MTIEEKATAYAESRITVKCPRLDKLITPNEKRIERFDGYDIEQAYEDGATEALASQWRSVEEELPSNDDNVLVYVPSTEFRMGGYEVAYHDGEDWYTSDGEHIRPSHFMYIPSLPDTNTEKK